MNPRIIEKTTIINDVLSAQQMAKPFIVRIPHLQTKSPLNTESGRVVIVKATAAANNSSSPSSNFSSSASIQQGTKSFSVVKLADGQIVLVPNHVQAQQPVLLSENGISRIIKAPSASPPNPTGIISSIKRVTKEQNTPRVSTIQITNLSSSQQNLKTSPQSTSASSPPERRLRAIAPARSSIASSANDLLTSLLVQQQLNAASAETLLRFDPTASVLMGEDDPLPIISETVTLDSNGSSLKSNAKRKIDSLPVERKSSLPVVSSTTTMPVEQKPKQVRKVTPADEKPTPKARLENKATSIIKDSRKKMTPRQVSTPETPVAKPVVDTKVPKTPLKRPVTASLPLKIDPEQGIRYRNTTHSANFSHAAFFLSLKNEDLRKHSSLADR